jgi:hypothetical protein
MFKSALLATSAMYSVRGSEINTSFYTGNGSAGLWWYDSANTQYIDYQEVSAGKTLDEITVCTF